MEMLPAKSAYCVATCPFAKSFSITASLATNLPSPWDAGLVYVDPNVAPLSQGDLFETTFDLVHAVDAAIPKAVRRKDDGHPARRTFQAVRIAVNDELKPLEQALKDLTDCLKPGGRICVITFHSLEDRIVKNCFRTLEKPCICPPKAPICTCGRKPVVKVLAGGAVAPSKEETDRNPRARSAKLRVAEKRATEE